MRRPVVSVLCICAAGCRIGFDAQPDAPPVVPADVAIDAVPLRACAWTASPTIGPVVHHTELASATFMESDPLLVYGDPLTIHFARDNFGQSDLHVAHRPALDMPFDPPQPIPGLSTTGTSELSLSLDATGHGNYVHGPPAGPMKLEELQVDTTGTFKDIRAISELDDGGSQYDPVETADGRTLWFTKGPGTNQDIYTATRATRTDPWSNVTAFVRNGTGPDGGASITSDGLLVVWSSAPDTTTPADIYFAVRSSLSTPWGSAQILGPGVISTTMHDLEPSIREDGCELFFSRSAAPSDGNWDIYSATLQ